jgi:hypothetical protein
MDSARIGMKDWNLYLGCIKIGPKATVLEQRGYGIVHSPPVKLEMNI